MKWPVELGADKELILFTIRWTRTSEWRNEEEEGARLKKILLDFEMRRQMT